MQTLEMLRIENDGQVGEGFVTSQPEGYMITYMTFDGYVDDGYFTTIEEANAQLLNSIKQAKRTAKEFTKRAIANGGMY